MMIWKESRQMKEMERVNLILHHPDYRYYLSRNEAAELGRSFCHHDLPHFLDVARIAYIMNLEQSLGYSKEVIYAVGLLHDIGRWKQYVENIPHHIASVELAEPILTACGYGKEEKTLILEAILDHRSKGAGNNGLNEIIYTADKASRACFKCSASPECNWSELKKNQGIRY